jgi:major membrane immunogen (membrane-anchored lipoprotein)
MRHFITTSLIAASLLLSACGKKEPDQPVKPIAGREETRGIRNTDAIGYSGSAIANKVDGALNANDQQKEKTDQALQNAE